MNIKTAAQMLGGVPLRGNRVSCPGPGHSKYDRSLVVTFNSDGTFYAKSFSGDDFKDCRDHVKARLGISDDHQHVPIAVQPVMVTTGSERARTAAVLRLWDSALPIQGTLAEVYLASRGLSYEGDALRFRPGCRSMVALITDALTGEPCGAHRTFLDRDGMAVVLPDGRKDKRMYGRASGGCVRLYEHEPPFGLAVAEGIETALAADFRPVWACLSSSIMTGFPVLPGVEALTVLADHDRAGIDAANAVGERWHAAGREVILTMPAEYGKDFADREVA
jgi:hypothetical protein